MEKALFYKLLINRLSALISLYIIKKNFCFASQKMSNYRQ